MTPEEITLREWSEYDVAMAGMSIWSGIENIRDGIRDLPPEKKTLAQQRLRALESVIFGDPFDVYG